jgi:hypothetical protein
MNRRMKEFRSDAWKCLVVELTASKLACVTGIPYRPSAETGDAASWLRRIHDMRLRRITNTASTTPFTVLSAMERADCYARRLLHPDAWE